MRFVLLRVLFKMERVSEVILMKISVTRVVNSLTAAVTTGKR